MRRNYGFQDKSSIIHSVASFIPISRLQNFHDLDADLIQLFSSLFVKKKGDAKGMKVFIEVFYVLSVAPTSITCWRDPVGEP